VIELFLQPSKSLIKNRVIDRVIRTISDNFGENQMLFYKPNIVNGAVDDYNNTPHAAFNNEFTPKEVQMHKDLEEYYIRKNMQRLDEVKQLKSLLLQTFHIYS
jgi:hypothetical protein